MLQECGAYDGITVNYWLPVICILEQICSLRSCDDISYTLGTITVKMLRRSFSFAAELAGNDID